MKLTLKTAVLAGCMIAGFASCKKILDVKPGTELTAEQMYRDVYDANAAVMGIYGKFMSLSDRYIILNELRGDLMEFTNNADEYLRQVSNHTVTSENPYINPRPFYELINNCNDVLHNFLIMRQTNKLNEQDFNQRYSDIGALRSFLYLQLGIHYGEVPYITEPLQNINEVKDLSRFPRLPLKVLLDTLITYTGSLPYKENYTANVNTGTGTSLNITLDGYPTDRFFINKKILLGELYLWKGDYHMAATWYKEMLDFSTASASLETRFLMYKRGWTDKADNTVVYSKPGDATTLDYTNYWGTMFQAKDQRFNNEMIWALPYDSKFKPDNPLIKLFSPIGGNYQVKASQEIIDNWNSQEQRPVATTGSLTGIPYDARGLLSQRNIGGQPTITKFIGNYISLNASVPINPLEKNGTWFLFRAAHLHLRFAEAANRDGQPRLAYAFFNTGVRGYNPMPAGETNVTNYSNTLDLLPDPYKFDARQGDNPYFRGPWHRNDGVRQRANLVYYKLTATSQPDSVYQIETGILNELALETAFEGTRWPDLLRVALRRNDPSFIADKIYNKLSKNPATAGAAAEARRKLLAREWFLPFRWE
jgi:starch-binding outer membrane protein, SusD/RagB family